VLKKVAVGSIVLKLPGMNIIENATKFIYTGLETTIDFDYLSFLLTFFVLILIQKKN